MRSSTFALAASILTTLPLSQSRSLRAQDAQPTFYDDVLPLLTEHCAGCHRPDKSEGDVVLTSHAAILAGADGTSLLDLDNPSDSLLLEVVCGVAGEPPTMPEDGDPLTDAQTDILRRWIQAGAPNDGTPPAEARAPAAYGRPPILTDVCWIDAGDGSTRIAVPGRHEVLVWRLDGDGNRRLEHRLPAEASRIESLAASPDGRRLAACGGSPARFGELLIWELDGGTEQLRARVTGDCLFGISWSPDGELVACGATDSVVRAFDATTGERVLFQGAHDDWVLDTTWSLDGSHLVTVGRDRSMKLIKVETEQFIDNITSITPGAIRGGLIAVDRHPRREEVLVGGADGVPGVFRTYRRKKRVIGDDFNRLHTLDALPGRVVDLRWSADGLRAYALSSDGATSQVGAWEIPNPPDKPDAPRGPAKLLWRADLPRPSYGLTTDPSGSRLGIVGRGPELTLLDASSGATADGFAVLPLDVAPTSPTTESAPAEETDR